MVAIHSFSNRRHARIMADTVLTRVYKAAPIDWAGGYDLQQMNERRVAYIAALKAADRGDIGPLMVFIGESRAVQKWALFNRRNTSGRKC
jgi:fido (protein-threonine AMPylation protein)